MSFLNFIRKSKWKIDTMLVTLVLLLSFYAWRLLPEQFIRGGSLLYLTPYRQHWWFNRPYTFTGFQTAAVLTSALFTKLFGANMSLYWWAVLIVMFTTYVFFYILVKVITKSSFAAFVATFIFSINYFGNFSMVVDCYCHLGERMIIVPLLLISFTLLHIFLEKLRKSYFILSLVFYFFAIGLAHFALLFTAPYVLYPIFWYFFNRKKMQDVRKGIIIGMSYMAISIFFVFLQKIVEPDFTGRAPFFQFLFHPEQYNYFSDMLRQLVYWSQYPILIEALLAGRRDLESVFSVLNAIQITPYVAVIYILVSIFIYKKLPKQRPMLFTIILGTAIIFYLNSWFGQYLIPQQVGSNRYLYYPTLLLTIFWSFFLWAAFFLRKKFYLIILAILAIYFFVNTVLMNDGFFRMAWANERTVAIIDYFSKMRKNLAKNTLVIAQTPEIGYYEAAFYTEQLGKGKVRLASENDPQDEWRSVASASAHIIKLTYDKECQCVKETKLK